MGRSEVSILIFVEVHHIVIVTVVYIRVHIIILILVIDRNVVGVVCGGSGGAGGSRSGSRGSGENVDIEESQGGVNFGIAVGEGTVFLIKSFYVFCAASLKKRTNC